jgi:hypothetical protein
VPRTYAIGDPQGPLAKLLEVLDRHGLLAGDRLADDVVLVSIGDHFDYDHQDPAAAREGVQLLRWLASHAPEQVRLLLGNHDAARVMELAQLSDADFAAARAASAEDYAARFAALPPQHVLQRDYASFTTEQRALVQELIVAGRFHLGLAGELIDGRSCLITHAGITVRELALLDLTNLERPPTAETLAGMLDSVLAGATLEVERAWQQGELVPLSLAPLHVSGGEGLEGGGLLYHRPSNPASGSKFDPVRPRRFDPRTLPAHLVQVAGHSGHNKCLEELGAWATERAQARKHGGIRSLAVDGQAVTYDLGTMGSFILIDSELRRVPAADVQLLELAAVD